MGYKESKGEKQVEKPILRKDKKLNMFESVAKEIADSNIFSEDGRTVFYREGKTKNVRFIGEESEYNEFMEIIKKNPKKFFLDYSGKGKLKTIPKVLISRSFSPNNGDSTTTLSLERDQYPNYGNKTILWMGECDYSGEVAIRITSGGGRMAWIAGSGKNEVTFNQEAPAEVLKVALSYAKEHWNYKADAE